MTTPKPQTRSLKEEIEAIKRGRPRLSETPEQAKKRQQAQSKAAALAAQVLKARHKDEYDEIYRAAKEEMGID